MRLLLDTHTPIWAVEQPSQLSPSVVTRCKSQSMIYC